MQQSFSFNSVPVTVFAPDSSLNLSEYCQSFGIITPLIVTDQGIVDCGLLKAVLTKFEEQSTKVTLFQDVLADPPEKNVLDACALAKAEKCDGVIGFGGGSSMDVAKLVAVLLGSNDQEPSQALKGIYGVDMISTKRLPLIQVPTTSGTGSEATGVAIVTTGESTKAGVVSPVLLADQIVLDPSLTLGLPAHVTAATGIDAMVHAIEAYTSKRLKNPISDMNALKALELLSSSIETAVNDGSNLSARSDMLLGAMLAGQAFANAPVAAVHALAYPLGGMFHIPHGLSNSLVLPHVIRFNAPNANHHYLEIALVIDGIDKTKLNRDNVGEVMSSYFLDLANTLGLQTKLREMDISNEALPDLAKQAMDQQRLLINNPRDVSYDDALKIYQQAF